MKQTISASDSLAACDRLLATFSRVRVLEQKRRTLSDDPITPPLVLYAISQMRMRIRPALSPGWLAQDPVHVALFGGTNSGKSTLLNVLLGRAAAGMHVTARFSQHPEAYQPSALGNCWLQTFPSRFAGYQPYYDTHPPRQSDDGLASKGYCPAIGVLRLEHESSPVLLPPATTAAVFWDVPDFSTTPAQMYLSAVLDSIALADIVILAVTDESYADDRTVMFFRMVSESGVSLHVVANKLSPGQELVHDIKETLDKYWRGQTPILPVGHFHLLPTVAGQTPEQRLRALLNTTAAVDFRMGIAHDVAGGPALKCQTLLGAVHFLQHHMDTILHALVAEVEEARTWEETIKEVLGREFLERYRSEYLQGRQYGEFNQALVRVLELVEVPGIGGVMKLITSVVRTPFRLVTTLFDRLWTSVENSRGDRQGEYAILLELFTQWLAALEAAAQTAAHRYPHPAWVTIVTACGSEDFRQQLRRNFEHVYASYRQAVEQEVQRRTQEIYQTIAQRPALLQTLRGVNLAVDAATMLIVVKSAGVDWSDAVIGPLMAGFRRVLVEAGMGVYLDTQQRLLKQRQFEILHQLAWTQLAQAVRELFPAEESASAVNAARRDVALLAEAVRHIAGEKTASERWG